MEATRIRCISDRTVVTPAVVDESNHVMTADVTLPQTFVDTSLSDKIIAEAQQQAYRFITQTQVPRTGVLVVGLGGNNGTTLTAGLIANSMKVMWETQHGEHRANWLGSISMCGTTKLGSSKDSNEDIYVPIRSLVPLLHPDDLVIGGWDISGLDMPAAMKRAKVLPLDVQSLVAPTIQRIKVMPGVYEKDFIASNQELRADNVVGASDKQGQLDQLRKDIKMFKSTNDLQKVIVVWSGNTERFSQHQIGIHDTAENLLAAVKANHSEIAPSLLYAMAAVLEGCSYINGSPQNTFCRGVVELARNQKVYLAGDDLKTGQTKLKSVLTDFLVSTALKPTSICSYNHLGNNDGLNLNCESQLKSKVITKASVVDDMIASNNLLYPDEASRPDHLIVIKYIPSVGDSKRALDEYTAKIFMEGTQTFVIHNTCEDSLLATPIILDLIIFMEFIERVRVQKIGSSQSPQLMDPLCSILSLFLKAPAVPEGCPVVNGLHPQREALINLVRSCAGLPVTDYLSMHYRGERNN